MHTSSTTGTAQERRALVIELLAEGHGSSQQALVEALAARDIEVTQATLSRDLKALGAVKGPRGYAMPGASPLAQDPLARAMGEWLDSATPAQNLVVLRTPPGGASPLAVVLDAQDRGDIVGTIAGDDTIMVITASSKVAKAVAAEFNRLGREGA